MLAADGPFLIQTLNLATEDHHLEGKLIRKGFLLLQLLLSALELPFITLNIGNKAHKMVLGRKDDTCCSWRADSSSPLRLTSGSRRAY